MSTGDFNKLLDSKELINRINTDEKWINRLKLIYNKFNRLFVSSFENEDGRFFFSKYYTQKIEIKDVKVLIDWKSCFDMPVKSKEETYEKNIEMSKSKDYTFGNLLGYKCFSKLYKLTA